LVQNSVTYFMDGPFPSVICSPINLVPRVSVSHMTPQRSRHTGSTSIVFSDHSLLQHCYVQQENRPVQFVWPLSVVVINDHSASFHVLNVIDLRLTSGSSLIKLYTYSRDVHCVAKWNAV